MIEKTIRVGISSCLLGEEVRFDGGHKHDTLITETLGKFFEWVPVCPEMELGSVHRAKTFASWVSPPARD